MRAYETQFQTIMESSMFREEMTIVPASGMPFNVSGIFYSGTREEVASAPYAPKTLRDFESFQVSRYSLDPEILDPKRQLTNATISSQERGTFKIFQVKGKDSGLLTLELQRAGEE